MSVVHVVPSWQEHTTDDSCWCQPWFEGEWSPSADMWVHRTAHDGPRLIDPHLDPALKAPGRHWKVIEVPDPSRAN